jgi:hypothetical protein
MMDLQTLKNKGGIVDMAMVKCEVVWKHKDNVTDEEIEDKFSVFVVRQAWGIIDQIVRSDEPGFSKSSALICHCVRFGDEGEQQMEYDEAFQLQPSLAAALLKAVNEVNKSEVKNSNLPTSSGLSSSSTESVEGQ